MATFDRLHQALAAAAEVAKACAAAASHEVLAERLRNEALVAELSQCKDKLAAADAKFDAVYAELLNTRGDSLDFFAGLLPGQGGVKPESREDAGLPAASSSSSAGPARGLRHPASPTAPPPAKRQAAAAPDL